MELVAMIKNDGDILNLSSNVIVKMESNKFTFHEIPLTMKSDFRSFKCIVGKNNEGKTYLLNEIFSLNNKMNNTYIFRRADDSFVRLGGINEKFSKEVRNVKIKEILEDTQIIKYSSTIELSERQKREENDISTSAYLQLMTLNQLHRVDMLNQITYSIDHFDDLFYSSSENIYNRVIQGTGKSVIFGLSAYGEAINDYGNKYFNTRQRKHITELLKVIGKKNKVEKAFMYNAILIILDLLGVENYEKISRVVWPKEDGSEFEFFFKQLETGLSEDGQKTIRIISEQYSYFLKNKLFESEASINFEDFKKREFLKTLIEKLKNDDYAEIYRLFELRWKGLSSGEISLLNLLGRISNRVASMNEEDKKKNTILLIDEVDLGLHPEWQRLWISKIRPLLSNMFPKDSQLIVTTHSPIFLSDVPKNDIIYLSPTNRIESTFAQNIYDLFNSSFVLDNVQGEFSTNYIRDISEVFGSDRIHDKILEFLKKYFEGFNEEEVIEYFEEAIKIIGEPILKNHFLNKLKQYLENDKSELIRYHERQIQQLKGGS